MAKQLTPEAFDFIKNNSELFGAIKELLEVDLVTLGTYMYRNKKMFSRWDIVNAVAIAMNKQPVEIFKETESKKSDSKKSAVV